MTREYFVRGQRKTVDELDNVVAIRVCPDDRGAPAAEARAFGNVARVREAGVPDDTLEAFERARWVFVEPSPEVTSALEARELVADAEETGKLVRRQTAAPASSRAGSTCSSDRRSPPRRPHKSWPTVGCDC